MSECASVSVFAALLACAALGTALFNAADCSRIRKTLAEIEKNHFELVKYLATKTAFEPRFKKEVNYGDHRQDQD